MAPPIAVYVHIPYCLKKCPYCDFNSYAISPGLSEERVIPFEEERYIAALLAEISFYARQVKWLGRDCLSVFFGGGTPSLFSAESLGKVISALGQSFAFAESCEVTLEANPGTIHEALGRQKLAQMREVGVNRISLGAQSFNPDKLKALGRIHSDAHILASVENIKEAGFLNFNLDLIYGLGDELLECWTHDLTSAVALAPTHISAYNLTVEPGTEFARLQKRGKLKLQEESLQLQFFEHTCQFLAKEGFEQYEISNFAKTSYHCRHNLAYWTDLEYLALGAGAHGYQKCGENSRRWVNYPKPSQYIEQALLGQGAVQREEVITPEQARLETLWCELRLSQGLNLQRYETKFGVGSLAKLENSCNKLVARGLIEVKEGSARLTKSGKPLADAVISELVVTL